MIELSRYRKCNVSYVELLSYQVFADLHIFSRQGVGADNLADGSCLLHLRVQSIDGLVLGCLEIRILSR